MNNDVAASGVEPGAAIFMSVFFIKIGLVAVGAEQDIRHPVQAHPDENQYTSISAVNPKYTKAIVLKEYYGYTVSEIAEKLHDTERNVYYYLNQAKKIGKKYKEGRS